MPAVRAPPADCSTRLHRMGLFSNFQRGSDAAPAAAEAGDPVQVARTRARQRLIGAVVLVVVGVIGFPLVFETQPRPISLDIPIEIPRRDEEIAIKVEAPGYLPFENRRIASTNLSFRLRMRPIDAGVVEAPPTPEPTQANAPTPRRRRR